MKKQLPLLFLLAFYVLLNRAAKALPVNVQKQPGSNELVGSIVVPSGGSITATGTGQIAATSLSPTYTGQTSITTLGTIATGTWNGTILAGAFGGSGVANTGTTFTRAGNFILSGAFAATFTFTATTSVTFPTTGTLQTLAGTENVSNKTITSSAFNGTIGATTPSTGVFTTITQGAGSTLRITSGTNQRAGNATLVSGTVTVSNTTVSANTVVMLTRKTSGGTIGTAITYTVSAATSFTITSDNILDTSTFSYLLIEVP